MKVTNWHSLHIGAAGGTYRFYVEMPGDGGRIVDARMSVVNGDWRTELVNGNYRNEEADGLRALVAEAFQQ